jgi:hypothetical protein
LLWQRDGFRSVIGSCLAAISRIVGCSSWSGCSLNYRWRLAWCFLDNDCPRIISTGYRGLLRRRLSWCASISPRLTLAFCERLLRWLPLRRVNCSEVLIGLINMAYVLMCSI